MNYSIFLDTQSQQFLSNFIKESHLRPSVGDVIHIGAANIPYVVTRIVPNTLTFLILDQDDNYIQSQDGTPIYNQDLDLDEVSLNYYVRVQNTSPDSISMGKDIRNLVRTMRHLGR